MKLHSSHAFAQLAIDLYGCTSCLNKFYHFFAIKRHYIHRCIYIILPLAAIELLRLVQKHKHQA